MKTADRITASQRENPARSPERKRSEALLVAFLDVALAVVDLLALNLSFLGAYFLRYVLQLGGEVPGEFDVSYPDYVPVQAGMTAILLVTFVLKGMYRLPRGVSWLQEVSALFSTTSMGVMVLFAAVSMTRYPASSRALFIYFWLLAVASVGLGRLAHRLLMLLFRRRGVGVRRVLVVGGGNPLGRRIMHSIATERSGGARVVGFVDVEPGEDFGRFRCLGTCDEVARVVDEQGVDEIVIALPAASNEERMRIIGHCRRRNVSFRVVPDLLQLQIDKVDVDTVNGLPLLAVRSGPQIRGWNLFVKRVLDVTVGVTLLTVLSPVLVLVAVAIKLDSPGPVLFRQTRVGRDGIAFTLYKFRSMKQGAEEELDQVLHMNEVTGPIFKIRNDPRMTAVGRLLRRTSLDEIPQLLNVLYGDMSLVGPRPPLPQEVQKYEEWHLRRLEVSPGITGLWQVSGRSEVPFDEMVMLDIYYVENWSLGMDISILLRTIPAVLTGGGAF
ncbi:MAG: sugar transferase [Chloroflexi bacterium]|nr:sugar transferase [Chloroflexota bacterium]